MTFQVEVTAPTQPASSLRTLTGNSGITADRDRRLSESAGHGGILAVPKPAPDLDPPAVTWYNSKSESELAKFRLMFISDSEVYCSKPTASLCNRDLARRLTVK